MSPIETKASEPGGREEIPIFFLKYVENPNLPKIPEEDLNGLSDVQKTFIRFYEDNFDYNNKQWFNLKYPPIPEFPPLILEDSNIILKSNNQSPPLIMEESDDLYPQEPQIPPLPTASIYVDMFKRDKSMVPYSIGIEDNTIWIIGDEVIPSEGAIIDREKLIDFLDLVKNGTISNVTDLYFRPGTKLPENSSFLFKDVKNLNLHCISNLDFSDVTNIDYMFCNIECETEKQTDSKVPCSMYIDAPKLKTMKGIFEDSTCPNIVLEFERLNAPNVENISYAFCNAYLPEKLDLSFWYTGNVKTMEGTFACLSNVEGYSSKILTNRKTYKDFIIRDGIVRDFPNNIPDVSWWNVSKVENINYMYLNSNMHNCKKCPVFDSGSLKSMDGVFAYSTLQIYAGDNLNKWNVSNVTSMCGLFYNCDIFFEAIGLGLDDELFVKAPYPIHPKSNNVNQGGGSTYGGVSGGGVGVDEDVYTGISSGGVAGGGVGGDQEGPISRMVNPSIINIQPNIVPRAARPTTEYCDYYRTAWKPVSSIPSNLNNWDVSNVTDMSYMFYNATWVPDISKWNPTNVENLSYAFYNSCLGRCDLRNWNMPKLKNINFAFAGPEPTENNIIGETDDYLLFKCLLNKDMFKTIETGISAFENTRYDLRDLGKIEFNNAKDLTKMFYNNLSGLKGTEITVDTPAMVHEMFGQSSNIFEDVILDLSNLKINTDQKKYILSYEDDRNFTELFYVDTSGGVAGGGVGGDGGWMQPGLSPGWVRTVSDTTDYASILKDSPIRKVEYLEPGVSTKDLYGLRSEYILSPEATADKIKLFDVMNVRGVVCSGSMLKELGSPLKYNGQNDIVSIYEIENSSLDKQYDDYDVKQVYTGSLDIGRNTSDLALILPENIDNNKNYLIAPHQPAVKVTIENYDENIDTVNFPYEYELKETELIHSKNNKYPIQGWKLIDDHGNFENTLIHFPITLTKDINIIELSDKSVWTTYKGGYHDPDEDDPFTVRKTLYVGDSVNLEDLIEHKANEGEIIYSDDELTTNKAGEYHTKVYIASVSFMDDYDVYLTVKEKTDWTKINILPTVTKVVETIKYDLNEEPKSLDHYIEYNKEDVTEIEKVSPIDTSKEGKRTAVYKFKFNKGGSKTIKITYEVVDKSKQEDNKPTSPTSPSVPEQPSATKGFRPIEPLNANVVSAINSVVTSNSQSSNNTVAENKPTEQVVENNKPDAEEPYDPDEDDEDFGDYDFEGKTKVPPEPLNGDYNEGDDEYISDDDISNESNNNSTKHEVSKVTDINDSKVPNKYYIKNGKLVDKYGNYIDEDLPNYNIYFAQAKKANRYYKDIPKVSDVVINYIPYIILASGIITLGCITVKRKKYNN